jgi:hypothetical protein
MDENAVGAARYTFDSATSERPTDVSFRTEAY